MSIDRFYGRCCLWSLYDCSQGLEWHHVWIYGGRQINEKWAIVPACKFHHDSVKNNKKVKELFERVSLVIATERELKKYPNFDWKQYKKYLKII